MNRAGTLVLAAGCLLLPGCSPGPQRPLTTRGLPPEDRYAFATQNGYDVGPEIRDAFLSGCLVKGMRREFVFQLYGIPDRNAEDGEGWEWLDRKGRFVAGVLFKGDKVDSIYGDPNGGGPPAPGCH